MLRTDVESNPCAERKSDDGEMCFIGNAQCVIDDSKEIVALSQSVVERPFTLIDTTKIETNRLDSRFCDVARDSRHDFVLHGPAELRMRMTNDRRAREVFG